MLFAVCLRYVKDHERAKDVLQESLVKICHSIGTYKNSGSFKSWLTTITINTCLKEIKKYRYMEDIDSILAEEYKGPTPIEELNAKDILDIIHKMPDIHRIVFLLHEVEGFNHGEIATMMNIAESSSRVYLTRAKNFLRLNTDEFSIKNKMV